MDELLGDWLRRRIAAGERMLDEQERARRKATRMMRLTLALGFLIGIAVVVARTGR